MCCVLYGCSTSSSVEYTGSVPNQPVEYTDIDDWANRAKVQAYKLNSSGDLTYDTNKAASISDETVANPNVYTTRETLTGKTWYNGKPIYRFVVYGNTVLSNDSGTFYTLPQAPSDVVSLQVFIKSGSIWYPLPWAQYNLNKVANVYVDGAKICLAFGSDWSGSRAVRVVIEYTK